MQTYVLKDADHTKIKEGGAIHAVNCALNNYQIYTFYEFQASSQLESKFLCRCLAKFLKKGRVLWFKKYPNLIISEIPDIVGIDCYLLCQITEKVPFRMGMREIEKWWLQQSE